MRKTNFESSSQQMAMIGLILDDLSSGTIIATITGLFFLDAVEER